MAKITLAALFSISAITLLACGNEAPVETPPTPITVSSPASPVDSSPTASPSAPNVAEAATPADLENIVVPEYCDMPEDTRLESGEVTIDQTRARAKILDFAPLEVDADADGAAELLAGFNCDAGGVPWPDGLVLVDAGGTVLDHWDGSGLPDVFSAEALERQGDQIHYRGTVKGAGPTTVVVSVQNGSLSVEPSAEEEAEPLSVQGYGELRIGRTGQELMDAGLAMDVSTESCPAIGPSDELAAHGFEFTLAEPASKLTTITLTGTDIATVSGARVGMSRTEIQGLYPELAKLTNQYGQSQDIQYVDASGHSMLFVLNGDVVERIEVHNSPAQDVTIMGHC